ncbi:hypothetical protein SAMN05216215_1022107 [Saccharopolyspora shandongensis]|uniref:Uncharacterized protein n=1 Tax=Saccharopolyspora shandongensis TaxID=418495 RepID=A0A1H3IB31_9PSEU|nr:hypothetical protein SAMN05216215_1022107 [Saccharopolyspora shandongensis]
MTDGVFEVNGPFAPPTGANGPFTSAGLVALSDDIPLPGE